MERGRGVRTPLAPEDRSSAKEIEQLRTESVRVRFKKKLQKISGEETCRKQGGEKEDQRLIP